MAVAFSKIRSYFEWCFKPHRDDKKHKGWKHPIFCLLVMSLSSLIACSSLASYFASKKPSLLAEIAYATRLKWGSFLLVYWVIMLCSRLATQKSRAFYDMLWACNISILLAIYGLVKSNPILIGASLITVSCDQILWYADVLAYAIFKKFHVGVAKYLIWPETTISTKITSTHHLWFIPLLAHILKKSGGLRTESFKVSAALTVLLWFFARHMLPKTLPGAEGKADTYMNVNLSWELWKDVQIKVLNDFLKDESYLKVMGACMGIWNTLNYGAFVMLKKMINN